MARLTREAQNAIKKKYNTDTIYSWSRISCYAERPWEYYIRYIQKHKVDTNNVYTHFGTIVHDLVQGVYEGHHTREDLPKKFSDAVTEWSISSNLKFPDENIERGYIDNLKLYFEQVEILDVDMHIEKPVQIVFENEGRNIVFIGYIDAMYQDEDGNIIILDFKTSSISGFTGKSLKESSKQLMLYAIGVSQMTGIPMERIQPRFDMAKYVKVSYLQKNGKWSKPSAKERVKMIESQENRIRKTLMDLKYDFFEAESYIDNAKANNSFDGLPEEVRERFKVEQAYIDVEATEETAKELEDWIIKQIKDLEYKTSLDNLEEVFPEPNLAVDKDSFFYYNLAPNLLAHHRGYQEQKMLNERVETELSIESIADDDLLSNLFK